MKKTKKNLSFILAIGLLFMNGLAVINIIFNAHINIDLIDFLKGLGFPIILWSVYRIIKLPLEKNA